MSDLDADLYGDLYGNEEGDGTEQPQQRDAENTAPPDATPSDPKTEQAPPVPKPLEVAPNFSAAPPAPDTAHKPYANPQPATPTPQPTQSIPTYLETPQEYPELPPPRGQEASYAGGLAERSIRPSEMKDEGKMFIGGLNWDTTDDALRNYFTQFGKVDACTIMRDGAGRSRCFAFLTFDDPASVNAVMVREHFLDGKIIDPKRAIPRQEHQRATKLFIGGLAGSVTSDSMREFFSQFGKVIDSTVMLDRETGRSKGFGFVSFEDTDVQSFLGFGNLEIDGKLIDVKLAQPRYQRDSYNEEGGGASDFGGMPSAGRGAGAGTGAGRGGFAGAPQNGTNNANFDPQALAALYTRMFQMAGGGGMNPMMNMGNAMMGGFGGMGGMGGMGGGMSPNMAGMGRGMGMGGGGGGGMGRGMGMGGAPAATGGNPNIPRGPRGAPAGPAAGGGNVVPPGGAAGVGPQRAGQRGQHNYHPYAR